MVGILKNHYILVSEYPFAHFTEVVILMKIL